MWVADMDFRTAPAVREALARRLEHGVFGYSVVPPEWNRAYADWWGARHSLAIDPDSLIFTTGVVPAISSMVRKLTTPAENVLIQTPVYNIFFNSILNNGRRALEAPLAYEVDGDDAGHYAIDWTDLEAKLADPQTTLMILRNPHNPTGMIWDRRTLARIGALCAEHHVTVVSDEIHCDLTDPRHGYVPFASVNEQCAMISATCLAPTKAFNIAGLQQELGGDLVVLALGRDRAQSAADVLLAGAVRIVDGGVVERDAVFEVVPDDLARSVGVEDPRMVSLGGIAEPHAAHADAGHGHVAVAEPGVFHRMVSFG
ncbi:aminotransferase class I/II-fold pyridoxal phosphate-dependent enzyme [Bifidobacterium sp. MA2]|uniref:cysteine-S-conjugate beta-lyase n=1 Tax=Bifidobacterium santillanense TaxID=2809028 RepID=A0ABS5UM81_9BIFI|nr:aminotransferase class I/II-fold pyridoxal phosphate-dependent enzyme [Bifidobacterium santillanense]